MAVLQIALKMPVPKKPGETEMGTMRYRRGETLQRSGVFQNSVSYIKVQENNTLVEKIA